ncbi:MAG TPA: peptidoglycan-binding domain-containing protein [Terriglobia bacterium]|nr:peptidoglycan-binding domain-containing protein [Terriglobia bacterium]
MKFGNKTSRWQASALMAVLLVTASCLLAAGEGKAAPPQSKAPKKKLKSAIGTQPKPAAHKTGAAKTVKHSGSRSKSNIHSAKGKRRLPNSSRQRLALLHLDPQRVGEIQQALIREGTLSGPPTGVWDQTTKDAMRRYQSQNGFAETGLPDARSLMKLGLGPHPLPDDVQAAAGSGGQAKVDSLTKPNN